MSEHAAEHGRQEASARFAKQAESAYAASDAVKDTIDSLDREDTDALQSSLDSQAS